MKVQDRVPEREFDELDKDQQKRAPAATHRHGDEPMITMLVSEGHKCEARDHQVDCPKPRKGDPESIERPVHPRNLTPETEAEGYDRQDQEKRMQPVKHICTRLRGAAVLLLVEPRPAPESNESDPHVTDDVNQDHYEAVIALISWLLLLTTRLVRTRRVHDAPPTLQNRIMPLAAREPAITRPGNLPVVPSATRPGRHGPALNAEPCTLNPIPSQLPPFPVLRSHVPVGLREVDDLQVRGIP